MIYHGRIRKKSPRTNTSTTKRPRQLPTPTHQPAPEQWNKKHLVTSQKSKMCGWKKTEPPHVCCCSSFHYFLHIVHKPSHPPSQKKWEKLESNSHVFQKTPSSLAQLDIKASHFHHCRSQARRHSQPKKTARGVVWPVWRPWHGNRNSMAGSGRQHSAGRNGRNFSIQSMMGPRPVFFRYVDLS